MQQLLSTIYDLAEEKHIPEKDIKTAIALLLSSASIQTMEICKNEENQHLDIEKLEREMEKVQSETDLEAFNTALNSELSSQNSSFLDVFNSTLINLLTQYLEKLKQL